MKVKPILIGTLLAVSLTVCGAQSSPSDAPPTPEVASTLLRDSVGLYPRVIQLAHGKTESEGAGDAANGRILASVVTFEGGDGLGAIYESTDGGKSFAQVGTVADPKAAGGRGLCCATLYEVPQQVGETQAGTLLWAASVGQDSGSARRMALRVWQSTDVGRSWRYLSSCAAAPNSGGLWEPEFSVDKKGRLVCHFADETEQPRYNQLLAKVVSEDGGKTWGEKKYTVAASNAGYRPGMPIVRRLPNGRFLMTYEICALPGQYNCAVFYRRSQNGDDWGNPAELGTRIASNTGAYFTHAPTFTVSLDGKLLLVGQLLNNEDGSLAEGSGQTLMVNLANGEGSWFEVPAPAKVPEAFNNYCPNYSSPLLPLGGGKRVLELASDYEGGPCKTFYATGAVPDTFFVNNATTGRAGGQFAYSDLWSYGAGCADDCFAGDDHFTNVAGAEVTFRFYGSQVTLYGAKDPGHGIAAVAIDRKKPTLVDYYAPTRRGKQAVYTSPELRPGEHTLTLRLTGKKNAAATDTSVTVDGAAVR